MVHIANMHTYKIQHGIVLQATMLFTCKINIKCMFFSLVLFLLLISTENTVQFSSSCKLEGIQSVHNSDDDVYECKMRTNACVRTSALGRRHASVVCENSFDEFCKHKRSSGHKTIVCANDMRVNSAHKRTSTVTHRCFLVSFTYFTDFLGQILFS